MCSIPLCYVLIMPLYLSHDAAAVEEDESAVLVGPEAERQRPAQAAVPRWQSLKGMGRYIQG